VPAHNHGTLTVGRGWPTHFRAQISHLLTTQALPRRRLGRIGSELALPNLEWLRLRLRGEDRSDARHPEGVGGDVVGRRDADGAELTDAGVGEDGSQAAAGDFDRAGRIGQAEEAGIAHQLRLHQPVIRQ
jgi:hypothetical protein